MRSKEEVPSSPIPPDRQIHTFARAGLKLASTNKCKYKACSSARRRLVKKKSEIINRAKRDERRESDRGREPSSVDSVRLASSGAGWCIRSNGVNQRVPCSNPCWASVSGQDSVTNSETMRAKPSTCVTNWVIQVNSRAARSSRSFCASSTMDTSSPSPAIDDKTWRKFSGEPRLIKACPSESTRSVRVLACKYVVHNLEIKTYKREAC